MDAHGAYRSVWTSNQAALFRWPEEIVGNRSDEIFGAEASRTYFEYLERTLQILEYPLEIAGARRWFAGGTMILITGATGNVGGPLAALLHARGQPVRAAVSSPQSVARLPDPALPWAVLNFEDPRTFAAAFSGVDKLFLMRPPHMADVEKSIRPLIDYAVSAGVRHIVFLSLIGAEKNKVVPHAKIEALLQAGPAAYTLLRAGFFMQNLSTTHREDIVEHDDVFIPAGKGKTAFVDTRDLAAVAALALTAPGHENKAYPLTGSEALDYYAVAGVLGEVLGRRITYSDPSPLSFAWRMRRRGAGWSYIGVLSAIYMTTRLGMAATVYPQLAELLRRPPITFRQFAGDEACVWHK